MDEPPLATIIVHSGVLTTETPSEGEVWGVHAHCVSGPWGTVPAFARGVEYAAMIDPNALFVCLHDDVRVHEGGWDQRVRRAFDSYWTGLAGFGGALGLGRDDLYRAPYDPMQLVRQDFASNLVDAEAHGRRTTTAQRVAVLDGFSQIGRGPWFLDAWRTMTSWGVVHHAYDAMLACFARRAHRDVWLVPVACQHFGGETAVGDHAYQAWARTQHEDGDAGFWTAAHRRLYDEFTDVLPIRIAERRRV